MDAPIAPQGHADPSPEVPPAIIEIDFEYVHRDNVDCEILERTAVVLKALPLSGNIRIVVTSQMDDSLSSRISETYSVPFRQMRTGVGFVTAKTVTDKSSSTEILVDARALLPGVREHTDVSLGRLLQHEGLHIVMRQREEDAHTVVRTMEAGKDCAEVELLWMGALALEELRIERSLCSRGSFATEPYSEEMPRILVDLYDAFADLGNCWGSPGAETGQKTVELVGYLMSKVAFVAAEQLVHAAIPEETIDSRDWRALIGPNWDELMRLGREVPDALSPLGAKERAAAAERVATIAAAWCEHIGIRLEDDNGELCVVPLHVAAEIAPVATTRFAG